MSIKIQKMQLSALANLAKSPLYLEYRGDIMRSLIAKFLFLMAFFLSDPVSLLLWQGLTTLAMSSLGLSPLLKNRKVSQHFNRKQKVFQGLKIMSNLIGIVYGIYNIYLTLFL